MNAFCFTINNYTDDDLRAINDIADQVMEGTHTLCNYIVFQLESGENHTPHVQGYLEIKEDMQIRQARVALHMLRASFRVAKGNAQKNTDYCTKEDTRTAVGRQEGTATRTTTRGKRTDLTTSIQTLRQHGLARVALDHPAVFVRYHRGLQALQAADIGRGLDEEGTRPMPRVRILWGPTRSGKSSKALAWLRESEQPDKRVYWYPKPQNGNAYALMYRGEHLMVIDDFGKGWLPLEFVLRICDRYPTPVNTQGSASYFVADDIVFTSNVNPQLWWPTRSKERKAAFFARVESIEYVPLPEEAHTPNTVESLMIGQPQPEELQSTAASFNEVRQGHGLGYSHPQGWQRRHQVARQELPPSPHTE